MDFFYVFGFNHKLSSYEKDQTQILKMQWRKNSVVLKPLDGILGGLKGSYFATAFLRSCDLLAGYTRWHILLLLQPPQLEYGIFHRGSHICRHFKLLSEIHTLLAMTDGLDLPCEVRCPVLCQGSESINVIAYPNIQLYDSVCFGPLAMLSTWTWASVPLRVSVCWWTNCYSCFWQHCPGTHASKKSEQNSLNCIVYL